MAETKTLNFETGLVEYDVNGACKIKFNPTDESFTQSLYELFRELEGMQEVFAEGEGFEAFRNLDKDMRGKIDALLGDGVSDSLFSGMNCYAIADGLPVWMNLVLAMLYEVCEAYEREFGKTDARVKAHTKKYNAILAKYRRK